MISMEKIVGGVILLMIFWQLRTAIVLFLNFEPNIIYYMIVSVIITIIIIFYLEYKK